MLYSGAIILNGGTLTDPPAELPTYVLAVQTMTYTDSTPGPEALTVGLLETSSDNQFTVETSGPVSTGITSAAAIRRWRALPSTVIPTARALFGMATTPVPILTEYKALFPSPIAGQAIWFRFREIFFASNFSPVTNVAFQTYRLIV